MKCLAIDDEPLALAQLSDYISRVPFLSLVKPCQDAFEAMKVLSDEDVDLIFVDINMPDLNGLDFIRSLPEQDITDISFITTKSISIQMMSRVLKKFCQLPQKTTRNLLWIGHPDGICILFMDRPV